MGLILLGRNRLAGLDRRALGLGSGFGDLEVSAGELAGLLGATRSLAAARGLCILYGRILLLCLGLGWLKLSKSSSKSHSNYSQIYGSIH